MTLDEEGQTQRSQPWTDDEDDGADASDRDFHVISGPNGSSRAFPTPVWLRESSKSFRWGWVPLPIRKAARATVTWVEGPKPPIQLDFNPLFPTVQEWPIRMMDQYVPKRRHRIVLLVALYICWFLPWALVLRHSRESGQIKGFGKPINIWCGYNEWYVVHHRRLPWWFHTNI